MKMLSPKPSGDPGAEAEEDAPENGVMTGAVA
jgi:hypothetical protein